MRVGCFRHPIHLHSHDRGCCRSMPKHKQPATWRPVKHLIACPPNLLCSCVGSSTLRIVSFLATVQTRLFLLFNVTSDTTAANRKLLVFAATASNPGSHRFIVYPNHKCRRSLKQSTCSRCSSSVKRIQTRHRRPLPLSLPSPSNKYKKTFAATTPTSRSFPLSWKPSWCWRTEISCTRTRRSSPTFSATGKTPRERTHVVRETSTNSDRANRCLPRRLALLL